MSDHRSEQIMDAIFTRISGLDTTRHNVERDRVYDIPHDTDNALSLYMGQEIPLDEEDQNWQVVDIALSVSIDVHVRLNSDNPISQRINQIKKEVVIAIDPTESPPLGLAFCLDLEELGSEEPEYEAGENPILRQRMNWLVKYRRSRSDPSTQ